jgi:phosphoribosylamine--glycine ligase
MASVGYPGTFDSGKKIIGLEDANRWRDVKIFHAGTTKREGAFYTSAGRVLGVTARAPDLTEAVHRAYEAVGSIGFEGAYYRKDIGASGLKK